jgi:hypothetical protein
LYAFLDYATESTPNSTWAKTYNIGVGSLLFWSVGLAPSKDVTWTTTHQPGGGFQYDQPNVELDYVLAVLSSGPVGIGDGIGYTNASLARMGANSAGLILRADKPLTAIDSTFVPPPAVESSPSAERPVVGFLPLMQGAKGCTAAEAAVQPPGYPALCQPAAEQTHTHIPLQHSYAKRLNLSGSGAAPVGATWRILVSVHLGDFDPLQGDLLPMPQQQLFAPAYYRELRWRRCANNTRGSQLYSDGGCLKQLGAQQPGRLGLNIASGEEAPATVADLGPGAPHQHFPPLPLIFSYKSEKSLCGAVPWRMFTLYPRLPIAGSANGSTGGLTETAAESGGRAWTLIGEVDKIVSVSALRFLSVGVVEATPPAAASAVRGEGAGAQSCLVFEIAVESGELVTIGAVTPRGRYVEATFDLGGSQRFCD